MAFHVSQEPYDFPVSLFSQGANCFHYGAYEYHCSREPAALTVHEKPVLEQDITTSLWLITVPLSQGSRGLSLFMQNL